MDKSDPVSIVYVYVFVNSLQAEYVRENGLGGIMYWSLDNDDFRGICNGEQYPLVEAGKKALFGTEGGIDETLNEARNLQKASAPAQQ